MLELFCALLKHHCKNLQRLNRGEQEFPSPAIFGNTGLQFPSQKSGMNFPLAFLFPKIGNGIFHLHSHSRKLGMEFAISIPVIPGHSREYQHPIPVPENWEWSFHFSSSFKKLWMEVFTRNPISEIWEWNLPFPFPLPKSKKSFPPTPAS